MSKKRRGYARRQPAPWRVLVVGGTAVAAVAVIPLAVVLNAGGGGGQAAVGEATMSDCSRRRTAGAAGRAPHSVAPTR